MVAGIALDHGEEGVLVAIVEAEPEAETVGERDLLLHHLGRIDRGRTLVLDHLARHQVAAVRCGVEQHIGRPTLDSALQHRLQRLVARVAAIERQIVAKQQEAPRAAAQPAEQRGQRGEVLAMDLDQRQAGPASRPAGLVDRRVHRLDQRALAGAAGAPQQRVVGGQAVGKAPGVVEQDVAGAVDALEQRQVDPAHHRHRLEPFALDMPDEGGAMLGIARGTRRRHHPLERVGDPPQERQHVGIAHRDARVGRAAGAGARGP